MNERHYEMCYFIFLYYSDARGMIPAQTTEPPKWDSLSLALSWLDTSTLWRTLLERMVNMMKRPSNPSSWQSWNNGLKLSRRNLMGIDTRFSFFYLKMNHRGTEYGESWTITYEIVVLSESKISICSFQTVRDDRICDCIIRVTTSTKVIFKELLFLGGMWEYSESASIKQR